MIKTLFTISLILILLLSCAPKIKREIVSEGPIIRVQLSTITNKDSILFTDSYTLQSEEAYYEFGRSNNHVYIRPLKDGLQIYNTNRNLVYRHHFPVILNPENENSHFIFKNNEYAGSIILTKASDSSLYLINRLPLEEYLKGVVPAEIFATKREYFEAVKAQAICARTYAINRLEENREKLFDIQSTIMDQVYTGFKNHKKLADQAINDTEGTIITHEGKAAVVYYHSTCGGKLESVQNVWPKQNEPYLQGGIDAVRDIFSCSASPHFRWLEQRSIDDLDNAFYKYFGKGFLRNQVTDTLRLNFNIQVLKRNSTGRIDEIEISYADTTVRLNNYNIRRFFAQPPAKYLRSNLFYFSQVNDSTLQIHGGGSGHGVGMCQFGALNMSERGFRYYHILNKYFPGTILAKKY